MIMIGNYTLIRQSGQEDFIAQVSNPAKCKQFWLDFFTGLFEKAKCGAWTGASINFGNFQFTVAEPLSTNVGFDVKDKNNNNFLIKFAANGDINYNACSIRASLDGTTRTLAKLTNNSCSCNYVITDDAIILWAPRNSYVNSSSENWNDASYLMIFRLNTNGSEVTLASWSNGYKSGTYQSSSSSGVWNPYFAPVSIILNKNGAYEIDSWNGSEGHTPAKGLGTHLALQNSKNGAGDRDSRPLIYDGSLEKARFDKRLWMPIVFSFENIVDSELSIGVKNIYNNHLYMSSPYKVITMNGLQGTLDGQRGLEKPCFTYVKLGNKEGIRLPYIFTQFQEEKYALFDTVYFYKN